MTATAEQEVLDAATGLVDAFSRHDVVAYFAAFRPDATFCFHSHPEPLGSRAAYEALWRSWEEGGFRVLGCTSTEQHVQLLGGEDGDGPRVAVFTHRVSTRVRPATDEPEEVLDERETIVFARGSGSWQAVHEHLSPVPD